MLKYINRPIYGIETSLTEHYIAADIIQCLINQNTNKLYSCINDTINILEYDLARDNDGWVKINDYPPCIIGGAGNWEYVITSTVKGNVCIDKYTSDVGLVNYDADYWQPLPMWLNDPIDKPIDMQIVPYKDISKQKLCEAIVKFKEWNKSGQIPGKESLLIAISAIYNLAEWQRPQWVNINDRLPDDGDTIVYGEHIFNHVMCDVYDSETGFESNDIGKSGVTYWYRLPEPRK